MKLGEGYEGGGSSGATVGKAVGGYDPYTVYTYMKLPKNTIERWKEDLPPGRSLKLIGCRSIRESLGICF